MIVEVDWNVGVSDKKFGVDSGEFVGTEASGSFNSGYYSDKSQVR